MMRNRFEIILRVWRALEFLHSQDPKWIGHTHFVSKLANVCRCRRPAAAGAGLPAPIGAEAHAVPANQRLWPYDFQRLKHPWRQAIESNKNMAVNIAEGDPFGDLRRSTLS
jgi:hypothetical protein